MMRDYEIMSLEYGSGDSSYLFKVGLASGIKSNVKSIVFESETPSFLRYVITYENGNEVVVEGVNIMTHRVPMEEKGDPQ